MKKLRQKDINFFEASRNSGAVQSIKKKNQKKVLVTVFPMVLFVACAAVWGVLFLGYLDTYAELNETTVYTAAMNIDSDYQLALDVEAQVQRLRTDTDNLSRVRQAVDSYPSLSKGLFETLASAENGKVDVLTYSYASSSGTLSLGGKATGISETALFVARLRVSGLFSSLGYAGYAEESTEEGQAAAEDVAATAAQKNYVFQVTGILRGKEAADHGNEASDET